jgi:hypothetical protein
MRLEERTGLPACSGFPSRRLEAAVLHWLLLSSQQHGWLSQVSVCLPSFSLCPSFLGRFEIPSKKT